jgi:radical SAM superfamily enzyme YgiQ (UPF0313 family)
MQTLFLIPPLTQLNTPYPATTYLTSFLRWKGHEARQGDLGLDLVLDMFNRAGLEQMFNAIETGDYKLNSNLDSILRNRSAYENTIDSVISFLQNKNYTLGYRIANSQFLPEANRFRTLKDPEWFFGHIGVQDKARYRCTMYLEDLADLIQATVGPHFGFSKYAERIARTAVSFDPIAEELAKPNNYLDAILCNAVQRYFQESIPDVVGFTVPFGGNLYGALKSAQYIKTNYPNTKVILGGGYANTELRELYDPRVFDCVDFICLDDGETPLLAILNHLKNPIEHPHLKRTFVRKNNEVVYENSLTMGDFTHASLPAPTYDGLRFHDYLSVIDIPNPMHRLWNDGRWNKLTIAHGCYWKKCSFCDISLDYISRFEQAPAKALVDKMEQLIAETGETGFHFVDEAAPPLAMRDLALEILSRGLQVTWWTNIRFEKTFTEDLCKLLAASGCIAVTGGLEVASPRLLEMMEKGITIDQVARVCKGFRDAGILVHAYLMYGFPTETEQETIDSLEIVRQLFQHGLLQSAHWHQFAMTVHSPVGMNPEKYNVVRMGPEFKGFANNDLYHTDPTGADHEQFSDGLKKALYNYMHGIGIDFPLNKFFNFPVPKTKVHPLLIGNATKSALPDPIDTPGYRLAWFGVSMKVLKQNESSSEVLFVQHRGTTKIELPTKAALWLLEHHTQLQLFSENPVMLADAYAYMQDQLGLEPEKFVRQEWWKKLRDGILLLLKK